MSVLELLRKGFGFLLMSFGISSPAKKVNPARKNVPEEKNIQETVE
jgi:hypothetical protein